MDVLAVTTDQQQSLVLGIALLVAITALLVAACWRLARLLRVRRGVTAGLRDPDPAVREVAVLQAGEMGLASTAPALLRAVRSESDPAVLSAVVRTVASRQWEPASTGAVVELRLWARAHTEKHPELRNGGATAPMLPGVAGAVPPPSLDPARAEEFRTRKDHVHEPADADPAPAQRHEPLPDPERLSPVRVLVTGAGGPAGVAVIRALRGRGHHVLAVDADPSAVGLRLADEHHVVPMRTDPQYVAALLRFATVSRARAIVCTVAEEYAALVPAADYLEEAGVATMFPSLDAVERCTDKWRFHTVLAASGVPTPATGLGSAEGVPGPWVVKPRFGRGSRDVVTASTRAQLASALRVVPDPIVQTMMTGREFTCDALVGPSGNLAGAAARWRLATRGGISTLGETFLHDEVANVVALTLKAVEITGPANVQGFVQDDGSVVVLEVNPRFSGGLPLSLASGADLVEEYLRAVLGLPLRAERLVARPGVRMMRHFSEVFEG